VRAPARPTRPAPSRRRAPWALAALTAASLAPGCATTGPRDGAGALERLIAAGARDERAVSAPLPPGVPDELANSTVDPGRAFAPLDEALAAVTPEDPPPAGPAPNPTAESIRLFISGRATRLSGDPAGAIAELQAAAQADPGAADPWRELAAAHRQMGDLLSAVAASRQALRLNPDDAESRLRIGLWELQRRDFDAAVADLAAARRNIGALEADAGARFVLDASLGRALAQTGRLAAGAELLASVRELPERFDAPTRFAAELDQVYRRRADSLRDAGDALFMIDRPDDALTLYLAAFEMPSLDPASILPRLTLAAMRAGKPAVAARALVGALGSSRDLSGQRLLPLIRHIAEHSSIRPALESAVAEVREGLAEDAPMQVRSLAARALAAAASAPRAARTLRDWLGEHPGDSAALGDLFGLTAGGPDGAIEQTVRLIESAPMHEARFAQALLDAFEDRDGLIARVAARPEPAARLLEGRLLDASGRPERAERALAAAPMRGALGAAIAALRIETLARLARQPEAEALLGALDDAPAEASALLKARALAALNRPAEALDALRDSLDGPDGGGASLDAALLAARLAWIVGDADAAEHYATRAWSIDPASEGAASLLLDLYAEGGPRADPGKLAAVVRRLREVNPSSRTLRWRRARELVAAGQYDRAETDLVSLAEEDPERPVVELLVALWTRTGSGARAEAWLREQIERRPHDATLVRALGRVLAGDERPEEALALLDGWLADHPYDDATARQAETLLRDTLGRVVEADDRALARLDARPPTLARAVERAAVLVRRNRAAEAADDLMNRLDGASPPAPGLAQPLVGAAGLIAEVAVKTDEDLRGRALALLDRVEQAVGGLPLELHDARLNLLSITEAPFERITDALDSALAAHPQRASELAAVAVGRLSALDKAPLAVRLAAHARARVLDPDTRFFSAWIQAALLALDADASRQVVRAIAGAGRSGEILTAMRLGQPEEGDRGDANLALAVADYFALNGGAQADAIALYDLALEFDPDHELALNNYGYYLADRGMRLDEAERMIRRSLQIDPSSGPTTDSLGWVLYKRGVIHDVTDEAGKVMQEGAATVLTRAARMPANRSSAEVIEHLGDALWAAGRRDEAVRRWRAAQALLEEALRQTRQNQGLAERFAADLARVRGKADAADAGAEPAVAPIVGPINAPAEGAPGGGS